MPRITRRRAAALSFAAVGLLAAGCADQSAALRVGDRTYSDADLYEDLDAYAANATMGGADPATAGISGATEKSYDQRFVSEVLQQQVTFMLGEEVFEDEGLELDEEARQATTEQLDQQLGGGFGDFPEDFRDRFVDAVARLNTLEAELGSDGLNDALVSEAETAGIEVSSRYGSWDATAYSVVPPEGPAASPAPGPDDPTAIPGG